MTRLLTKTENQHIEKSGIKATCLYTHTEEAEATNKQELEALSGEAKKFLATDSNQSASGKVGALCPAPTMIELKTGAQVGHQAWECVSHRLVEFVVHQLCINSSW